MEPSLPSTNAVCSVNRSNVVEPDATNSIVAREDDIGAPPDSHGVSEHDALARDDVQVDAIEGHGRTVAVAKAATLKAAHLEVERVAVDDEPFALRKPPPLLMRVGVRAEYARRGRRVATLD